jgi:hypothetical protein
VADLLLRHLIEYLGRGGKRIAQTFGEIAVDAAILFFAGYRQRQDFLLGEVSEPFQA